VKVEQILAPQYPTHGTFLIEMYNEHHQVCMAVMLTIANCWLMSLFWFVQYFHDSVSLGFNVHYYRTLKVL